MAVINIDRKTFEEEIGKLDVEMQGRISMFGTPLEKLDENEIQIEIFPNRPDMLSYQGFKRAFLAFLGKKIGLIEYKINKPKKNYEVIVDSSVKNIRPYTACAIVTDLKLNDKRIKEIIELQEKLHTTVGRKRKKLAIGIYPLEKISLPITFKALEPEKIKFAPLNSAKEMSGIEILRKHPAGVEYSHLLKGKEKFPVFTDTKNNILSMPPIINSELTGKITESTKDVFVECSGFDLEILKKCLNILCATLADMEGTIYQMDVNEVKTPDFSVEKMKLSLDKVNKLLGLGLTEKQVQESLEKMGYGYNKGTATIPAWRTDILHEVDLIEDIAIAYGYENFIPEIPSISTIGEESKREIIKKKISEILTGLNIIEVSNYHLTTKEDQFKKMSMNEKGFIQLNGSKTEYNILRKDLSHFLLKNISENVDVEYPQKIFEVGKVFEINDKIKEEESLAIVLTPGNFTEIKQVFDYLMEMIDLKTECLEPKEFPPYMIDGRTLEIKLDKKSIGFMGEVHPRILRNWKIKMPIAILEINLEDIIEKLVEK
ncbi:phenylalanine--tRNA ligase subunit beta [Candidatus Pacearchaeota archaeon]|nr:phenylalanine--tRNA ligase subunit beta [Candidatus Pacearchaeota archaeon]